MKNLILLIVSSCVLLISCKNENISSSNYQPNLPAEPYDYQAAIDEAAGVEFPNVQIQSPSASEEFINFGLINCFNCGFQNSFTGETQSISNNESATLGRVLFYDRNLSQNNTVACASCHKQELGFADNKALSLGFGNKKTARNAMALANPILNNSFFWDSRQSNLNDLSLDPVQNHVEMGIEDLHALTDRIENISYYPDLFKSAFGFGPITESKIRMALTDFMKSTFKADSKFDQGFQNEFANYSEMEKLGMALFFSENMQCAGCHAGANFAAPDGPGGEYAGSSKGTTNNGLDVASADIGLGNGSFKIPSLRNIALTAPYMHDGRFANLEEVMEFYNTGVQAHPDLDGRLRENGIPRKLNLSSLEKDAMIAFLNTLTSQSIQTDEKLANPFY